MSILTRLQDNTLTARVALVSGTLVIVGLIGFSAASAATGTPSGTGYGISGTNGQQAAAAADTFQSSVVADNNTFVQQVNALEATAKQQLQAGGVTDINTFSSSFNAATSAFQNANDNAFNTFRAQALADANTAASKDQFIDQFNHAKADYLNQLDAAKNQLADSLSKLGNNGNVVKDNFMNGFNSDRDAYSNQLEQAKNDFAATVSNL